MREMKDSGVEWIGQIPTNWSLERLQWHLVEIRESNNPIKTTNVLSLTNKLGVIPYEEKGNQGNISKEHYEEYNLAYPETIVANSMNILIGSVGICNYFGCVSPVYFVFQPKEGENISFINYLLQVREFQRELRRYANGILEIRLRVSVNGILKRYVPFPDRQEQRKIANFLDAKTASINALITNNEAQMEQLRQYKQSLITETVTRGLDPNAPMKDSGVEWIGQIPQSWKIRRVRDIGWTQNGISKSGEFFGSGFPFVSYGDVYRNYALPNIVTGQIESDGKERENYSVRAGDIFFTRTSETIEEVGFSSVCKATIPDAVFAGFLIRLRPYKAESIVSSDYAKYYFRGSHIRGYLTKEMNLVTRASLSQGLLKAMSVLVPPMDEQKAIAEYLDRRVSQIETVITLKQSKIEKLKQYRQSLIYEYVTGKKEVRPEQ